MPIANRCVVPVCVSQVKVPGSVENEFEYIFNATLSNFIKQIACLTIKAKDIFDELAVSLTNIVDRSSVLESKIDQITLQVRKNNSTILQPLVSQQIEVYKIHLSRDDERFVQTEMPDCIREMFDSAEPPPELYKFDEFRKEDESMKYFTDPDFFLREWLKNVRVDKKKKKEKKKRKSLVKAKENLPFLPPPPMANPLAQEPVNDECTINYNFGDVAIYEDLHGFNQRNTINKEADDFGVHTSEHNDDNLPPPPPPPPLPPPPPGPISLPVFTNAHSNPQPATIPQADPIQSLLRDIQKGTVLKPVTAQKEAKRKTMDFRAMIAELRPAWDNNSESDESDED